MPSRRMLLVLVALLSVTSCDNALLESKNKVSTPVEL
jgi:hypothetical protein